MPLLVFSLLRYSLPVTASLCVVTPHRRLKEAKTALNEVGTKVGPDQLRPPVRVGSTRIDSDQLGSNKKVKVNFAPKRNVVAERYEFRSRAQKADESFYAYT